MNEKPRVIERYYYSPCSKFNHIEYAMEKALYDMGVQETMPIRHSGGTVSEENKDVYCKCGEKLKKEKKVFWSCPRCGEENSIESQYCGNKGAYWDESPCRYKRPSNCFITTSTLLALSKSDDCYELNKFREFRDTYLSKVAPQLIDEYYEIAPSMVATLDNRDDKDHIYRALWDEYLLPCLKFIEESKYEETQKHYVSMVRHLEQLLK
jgi:predicted RNA-binding Zn-ribbon protein involved in translation (DUF1610 family)